ncbi:MAG: hypothetical protein PHX09_02675 [Clostridia bacterium]|nr:hypothetical protein [Clostridia bacterium]MDD4685965.1 hypothetical protein [Clostridia bacterium]
MILSEIQRLLGQIFVSIDWDIVFFIGIGFQILITIFFIIKSHYAYEMRIVRKLVKLNTWLSRNQYIDSNNLLAFNDLMKKTPKLLRYHWHQYMLYREKEPSFYMSPYNCIEKPLKTSSFKSNIKNYTLLSFSFAFFIFVFSIVGLGSTEFEFLYLAKALITSVVVVLLCTVFVLILRARENRNLSALYQYFHYFNRFMDRAVTTMPPYVDFEVLFTNKEIRRGIPVLNEYLEKRARQEAEELEKARLYAIEHEVFDFSEAGLNGSLVLDRAMKESETYLNIRQRLLSEIEQFEGEIESLKRNYENTQREYEKRMQTSKENISRLRKQQEESTNRIESNYIKKQQSDEIKKQEQLEKDHDSATFRFNQEMEVLVAEIDSRRADLEERRKYVEEALKAEYQTFSLKMYKSISEIIEDKNKQEKENLISVKDEIAEQLEDIILKLNEKNQEINELKTVLKKHKIKAPDYGGFQNKKLQDEVKKRRNKNLEEEDFYPKHNNIIKKEDEQSGVIEISPDDEPEKKEEKAQEEKIVSENFKEQENKSEVQTEQKAEPDIKTNEVKYDENGGHYDAEGNYRYKNGSYYDTNGIYHDEFGGWFEADGVTYHKPENSDNENLKKKNNKIEPWQTNEAKQSENNLEAVFLSDNTLNDKINLNEDFGIGTKPEEQIVQGDTNEIDKGSNDNNSTLNSDAKVNNVVKKRPGRPRKIRDPNEEVKPKRPRGRPRKKVEDTGEPKVKRGRGRPRKVQITDEESAEELQKIDEQIENENSKLKQQQDELKSQLDEALSIYNDSETE